jgi:small subunit ribosomal protein S1
VPKKYPPGTKITGKVRNLTNFGAFVEIEEGIDGMVHVSDMSWSRKVTNPAELLKKGQTVDAVVLEVDSANQRVSLGMKQLEEDPWRSIDQRYKMGDLVQGKVVKLASFGAFIELPDKLEGLVHISQISEDHIDKIKNVLKVGDEVSARVIKVDAPERRIGLSIKAATNSKPRKSSMRPRSSRVRPSSISNTHSNRLRRRKTSSRFLSNLVQEAQPGMFSGWVSILVLNENRR